MSLILLESSWFFLLVEKLDNVLHVNGKLVLHCATQLLSSSIQACIHCIPAESGADRTQGHRARTGWRTHSPVERRKQLRDKTLWMLRAQRWAGKEMSGLCLTAGGHHHTGGETLPKEKAVWAEGKGRGDWLQKPVSKTECWITTGPITTEVLQGLWWMSQYQAAGPEHIDV